MFPFEATIIQCPPDLHINFDEVKRIYKRVLVTGANARL